LFYYSIYLVLLCRYSGRGGLLKIKVVSFDIFQTLVDVNQRIPQIWKGILGDTYTQEEGLRGAKAVLDCYPQSLLRALTSDRFLTMEEVYMDCARNSLTRVSHAVSPEGIVEQLLLQHAMAPLYQDVKVCMDKIHSKYSIILSSDSNHRMVDGLLPHFSYDELFISDDLGCYKGSPDGSFFHKVMERIGVKPEEILHIGDSHSDVLGASRAGILSCWLNRDMLVWGHEIKPDYVINSLEELDSILEL
jgi:HAD superfamily hydrolase (TIGR01509 family)